MNCTDFIKNALQNHDFRIQIHREILYNSILRKKFIKILKKTKFLEKLDKRIFNIKKIKKIIDLYLKNKDIGSENYIFLLNLLGLIKINNF